MFLRHTTGDENNVGTWAPAHVSTDSIFRGDAMCWRTLSKNENVW